MPADMRTVHNGQAAELLNSNDLEVDVAIVEMVGKLQANITSAVAVTAVRSSHQQRLRVYLLFLDSIPLLRRSLGAIAIFSALLLTAACSSRLR